MKTAKPHRIAIIGIPGSGKSTFATKLGKLLDIPVHHLDKHRFEPNGEKKDKQEFLSIQKTLIAEDAWIIEGCSFSTYEMRFARADMVIYFHFPRLVCIARVLKRFFIFDKALSETGCLRGINGKLLKYIWNFDKEKRADIEAFRKKYPHVHFCIFKNSQDANNFNVK